MEKKLQLALDFVDLDRAIKAAEEALSGGVDWLECGTPLIKSEGLEAVRSLRARFPGRTIVADMKIMDAGRIEVEAAAKSGAGIIGVLGAASDETIRECVEAAENVGAKIIVDMINVADPAERAKRAEELGAHFIGIHTSIDVQMSGGKPFEDLKKVRLATSLPIAVAGGINSETAALAVENGANIVIVGGAISKAVDAAVAAKAIKDAIKQMKVIETDLFRRTGAEEVAGLLRKLSTPNISDALHRAGQMDAILPIAHGTKLVGTAITVRTYPGDWAKPVEAIDLAKPGDVIVIDAGGVGPAVWGELATHSALKKGIAGIVVDGAVRDTPEIRSMGFAAFARLVTPAAGEPKGLGETGVTVRVGGVRVREGDWLVGDDDGVVVLPKEKAVEYANRAMDVLEKENRLRKEIEEGRTLSEVSHLLKWEKRK